jgi:hypothetical protein
MIISRAVFNTPCAYLRNASAMAVELIATPSAHPAASMASAMSGSGPMMLNKRCMRSLALDSSENTKTKQ